MTEIMIMYIYDWTVDEGLRDVLHQYNAEFECKKTEEKMICISEIPNPGVYEIKVRGPEVVAVSEDEVLLGKRAIIPLEGGKLKIVTKIYKKKVTQHRKVVDGSN